MIEGLNMIVPRRLSLLRSLLIFSLLISVILSCSLWVGVREFPLTPVWQGFVLNPVLNWTLFFLLLLVWLAALVSRFQRMFLFFAILLSVIFVLADMNRLQPWFYIYSSLLLILLFYNGRVDNPNTYNAFFVVLQLVLSSVYFFNGYSMLNPDFVHKAFTPTIEPIHVFMSDRQFTFFTRLGYGVPFLLMFTGIGLMFKPLRFLAIAFAVLIHLLLLVFLFPVFNGTNYPLWFMNLVFPVFIILLFSGSVSSRYFNPAYLLQKAAFYPVVAAFLVLPFFNRLDLWPDFLSGNFLSGNSLAVKISLSETAYTRLPENLQKHCYRENFSFVVDYRSWCTHELHTECYPSEKVFKSIFTYFLIESGNQPDEISMDNMNRYRLLFKR